MLSSCKTSTVLLFTQDSIQIKTQIQRVQVHLLGQEMLIQSSSNSHLQFVNSIHKKLRATDKKNRQENKALAESVQPDLLVFQGFRGINTTGQLFWHISRAVRQVHHL